MIKSLKFVNSNNLKERFIKDSRMRFFKLADFMQANFNQKERLYIQCMSHYALEKPWLRR